MADNILLNAGSGGATLAADDIGPGVWYQIVKLAFGPLDTATLVTATTGLPVGDAGGSLTVDNAGTFAVQVDGAALTSLQLIDNLVLAEDSAHVSLDPGVQMLAVRKATPATLSGADGDYEPLQISVGRLWASATIDAALPAGTNNIGDVDILSIAAGDNNIGNVDVVTLPALPAGTNNIGDVDVLTIAAGANLIGDVGLQPRTTGGLSFYKTIDLDETEEEVKATAGQIYGLIVFNLTAALLYFKIYNATAASVVVGTTVPDLTIPIPGNNDTDGAGFVVMVPQGIAFGTAITIACTTLIADNDATAPAANACAATVLYK